ncbi:proline-rich protein 19 isoform X1 [Dendrobates tinctorius]|uniref:proline-rich protein 19 isoform X1 n=1 Tax=Dendrobates tinctorius TaxID=92724 RepID=UPI003CCA6AD1
MMSRDDHSHSDPKLPLSLGPNTCSVFYSSGNLMKINDCKTNKPLKIKRRKTKKELNNAKFKSRTEIFKKKTFSQGVLQRNNMVVKMVSQSGMKAACNSRQVFITENRLTHHQGIFNHEIKSIDIGRIVNQTIKVDLSKTGSDYSRKKTPQSQGHLYLGLIPTPELKNQDVHSSQKEHSTEIPACISEPAWRNQEDNEPTSYNQQDHERASCYQQDHERASCYQQDHERASCYQQDHERTSCYQQDHERASCYQQDHERASCYQQDHERASCYQQDHERASCYQQDHERASCYQQDHERASCYQQDHERASCYQQDHERASCYQQDHERASCYQQDHERASCNQQDHERASCNQQDHERASCNQQDHERASCNQQDHERASCNQQDHERASCNQQDHERASCNQQDHERASCNQQDHERASCNQQDHERASCNQQDHERALCNQQDHERALCNQQDHERALCTQKGHERALFNPQGPSCALCNQENHEHASHHHQYHKHALYSQQDHKRASGNRQNQKRASGIQQDHECSSGIQQEHESAFYNQQYHERASGIQEDVKLTWHNQQSKDPAFCNQLDKEILKCQSNPQNENQANRSCETTMSPFRNQSTLVLEAAKDIVNMLDKHSFFHGRNLISDTRQAILQKVRRLRDTKPPPPAVPVQRSPANKQTGNVHMYKDLGFVDKTGTDIRKLVQTTQRGRPPIQTSTIRYQPFPSNSPAHTLIKMANQEDHLSPRDTLHQPMRYESDCNFSRQYRQIPSQSLPNILISSSHNPKPSRRERKSSSFCRVRTAGKTTSSPLIAYSPQVRWRLANDLPTDSPSIRKVPLSDVRYIVIPRATNQECISRTSLEDISEVQNPSRVRIKKCFPDGEKTSEVFWGSRDQRSPTTKSPAPIRMLVSEQNTHNAYSAKYFGSHHGAVPQTSITNPDSSLIVFPLDLSMGLGREAKRHMSSWQEGGVGPHWATHAEPKLRCLPEPTCPNTWDPSSLIQKKPKNRRHGDLGNDGGIEWMHSRSWRHGSSQDKLYSQPMKTSAALCPQSGQQGSSFLPFQRRKSPSKPLLSRPSPDTWVYPRMRLY